MSIPVRDLEPGGIYCGCGGQLREVVSIDIRFLTYRVTKLAYTKSWNSPKLGETRKVKTHVFAEWALGEVA